MYCTCVEYQRFDVDGKLLNGLTALELHERVTNLGLPRVIIVSPFTILIPANYTCKEAGQICPDRKISYLSHVKKEQLAKPFVLPLETTREEFWTEERNGPRETVLTYYQHFRHLLGQE